MRVAEQDILSSRGNLSLDLLSKGESSLQIENISIANSENSDYELNVWTAWNFQNLTEATAVKKLENGYIYFHNLLGKWNALKALIGGSHLPTYLCENYGMGSIIICERCANGDISWRLQPET